MNLFGNTNAYGDFDAPPTLASAEAARDAGMQQATDHAEADAPGFSELARAFVLNYLREHGPTLSEDIVDAAERAGIRPPTSKAFGGILFGLSRNKRIEKAGYAPRRKGHGSGASFIWRLTEPTS